MMYKLLDKRPKIDPDAAFVSENAVIIGDVEIGKGCTIFDNVVIEGFPMKVKIGKCTNIQSGTIIHGLDDSDTIIGDYCTIGHRSIIHGAKLEELVTVGLGSTVMGKSVLKKGTFIGANALITEKKVFEERSLVLGVPGEMAKVLPESSLEQAKAIAKKYVQYGTLLRKELKQLD